MNLRLSEDQALELDTVLESVLGDLKHELADTDNPEFRAGLKARFQRLETVFKAVRSHLVRTAGVAPDS